MWIEEITERISREMLQIGRSAGGEIGLLAAKT